MSIAHADGSSTSDSRTIGVHLRLSGVVADRLLWLDTLTIDAQGLCLTYELSPGVELSTPRTWRWLCDVEDDLGTVYEGLSSGGIEPGGAVSTGTRSSLQRVPAGAALLALAISTPRTPHAPFGVEIATAVLPLTPGAGADWARVDRERTGGQLRSWQHGERDESTRRRLVRKGLVDVRTGDLTPLAIATSSADDS